MQEARETQSIAKKNFFNKLMAEFDKDREVWLKMVRVVAELDCLISLTKASEDLDEPRCRPEFVESEQAFIDFADLRHPSMCLQRDFIANDVQLGGDVARTTLLTGPNMAGKSTLLRMTAAGVIMAQMGCYVPASRARLSPIDKIQTRMGAYDSE
jgi:DNA mismatch repair protein MSH6